jgi:hypothetical protein
MPTPVQLAELTIADPPERWRELGFSVSDAGQLDVGGVRLQLGGAGAGITSWALRGAQTDGTIDGLQTTAPSTAEPPAPSTHSNGALGVDHIVVVTNEFGRTSLLLEQLGAPIKYTREQSNGSMGFVRIGPAILELVHVRQLESPVAVFWGITFTVADIDALAAALGERLGTVKQAVQPGRRIGTVTDAAGLSTEVAFMSPQPPKG